MKILHIEDSDCDGCGDFLKEDAANRFINGGFTHIENEGYIIECEVFADGLVSIGEQVAEIEGFDGYYVHYNKVIDAVNQAWDEPRCYGNDPLELIVDLINERDELKEQLTGAQSAPFKVE